MAVDGSVSVTPPDADARLERIALLLARCGNENQDSLEELYRLTSPRLFGTAVRMVRNEALAEEVLQEAFLKIWKKASTYSPALGAPLAWLTSIVRHEALDTLRRRRVREDHESPQHEHFADLVPDLSPGAAADAGMLDAELLMRCLERLEPPARDCIVRAYCEGYSHDELSASHDAPLGTVKSWIRRGLMVLRGCIDEHT